MKIEPFRLFKAIYHEAGKLPPNDFAIYMRLVLLDNELHWEEWFTVTYERLCLETCIRKPDTVQAVINRLQQRNYIEVKRGGKHKANSYKIVPIYMNYPAEQDNDWDNVRDNSRDNVRDNPRDNSRDNNRELNKTKTKTKTETKTRAQTRQDVFDSSSETEEVKKALKDFADMRTKARSPMTDRAKELLLGKLNDMAGNDNALKVKLLEQSIERGWKTVFALKDGGGNGECGMGRTKETDQGGNAEKERADSFREECRRADANQIYPWEVHEPA